MPDGTVVRDSLEIVMHVNNLPATVPRPTLIPEDLSALLAIEKTIHFMYHLIGNQLVVGNSRVIIKAVVPALGCCPGCFFSMMGGRLWRKQLEKIGPPNAQKVDAEAADGQAAAALMSRMLELSNTVKNSGGSFLCGAQPTTADFYLYSMIWAIVWGLKGKKLQTGPLGLSPQTQSMFTTTAEGMAVCKFNDGLEPLKDWLDTMCEMELPIYAGRKLGGPAGMGYDETMWCWAEAHPMQRNELYLEGPLADPVNPYTAPV